jgi:3-dehydroquinate dehydratase-2
MTKTVYVLNGPNLNLLGTREPRIYGSQTLAEIGEMLERRAKALKLRLDIRQSNHEGVLVDWLHEAMARASAVIVNAGGYAHSSIAIRDAVAALPIPVIEVHLSNVMRASISAGRA